MIVAADPFAQVDKVQKVVVAIVFMCNKSLQL